MKVRNLFVLTSVSLVFLLCRMAHAEGVEDLLVDFSDYLSTRLIPAATMVGVGLGGIMAGFGSQKGIEIVKWSVAGGIIGTAGAQTLSALFF